LLLARRMPRMIVDIMMRWTITAMTVMMMICCLPS
jgi:hypothetical protein